MVGVFAALSGIGGQDSTQHALSQREIARELNEPAPSPTATGKKSDTDTKPKSGTHPPNTDETSQSQRAAKNTKGGTVVVSCRNGDAHLDSWSPAPGFESDDKHRGPDKTVSIEFEGEDLPDYLVTASCVDGMPHVTSVLVDD